MPTRDTHPVQCCSLRACARIARPQVRVATRHATEYVHARLLRVRSASGDAPEEFPRPRQPSPGQPGASGVRRRASASGAGAGVGFALHT